MNNNSANFNNNTLVKNYLERNNGTGTPEVLKINKYTTKSWVIGLFFIFLILTEIKGVCIAGSYVDSAHFFNLSTPSVIFGASFKIKVLSIFCSSLVLFINF